MSSNSGDASMDAIESRRPAEAKKQRGRPFKAGRSGNPEGRPRGSRNKATIAVEALLDGEAKAIAAHHYAVLQNYTVPDAAKFPHAVV